MDSLYCLFHFSGTLEILIIIRSLFQVAEEPLKCVVANREHHCALGCEVVTFHVVQVNCRIEQLFPLY